MTTTMARDTKATWILVADRVGAVVYRSPRVGAELERVDELQNPRGRLKSSELGTDRPGRAFDRVGGGRHSYSEEVGPAEQVTHEFVQVIVARLEQARLANELERLVLVASPQLLGELRASLPGPLADKVVGSLAKDLAHADHDELRRQLADLRVD